MICQLRELEDSSKITDVELLTFILCFVIFNHHKWSILLLETVLVFGWTNTVVAETQW